MLKIDTNVHPIIKKKLSSNCKKIPNFNYKMNAKGKEQIVKPLGHRRCEYIIFLIFEFVSKSRSNDSLLELLELTKII